jgi:hypothetical protein
MTPSDLREFIAQVGIENAKTKLLTCPIALGRMALGIDPISDYVDRRLKALTGEPVPE